MSALFGIASGVKSIYQGLSEILDALPAGEATFPREVVFWFTGPDHELPLEFPLTSIPPVDQSTLDPPNPSSLSSMGNLQASFPGSLRSFVPPAESPSNAELDTTLLQQFAGSIHSAANLSSITSAFPPPVVAMVALTALGFRFDENAILGLMNHFPVQAAASLGDKHSDGEFDPAPPQYSGT